MTTQAQLGDGLSLLVAMLTTKLGHGDGVTVAQFTKTRHVKSFNDFFFNYTKRLGIQLSLELRPQAEALV